MICEPGVAGVDEAGRGPLAGPVAVASVIMPEGFLPEGLDDSKKLNPQTRARLALEIRASCQYAVILAYRDEVDAKNILRATLDAMSAALSRLCPLPERAVIDGHMMPPGCPCVAECMVEGDGRHAAVAAASILAKTTRDAYMVRRSRVYPGYGFDHNFGYATPEHLDSLWRLGPCPEHRETFAPVVASMQRCLIAEA